MEGRLIGIVFVFERAVKGSWAAGCSSSKMAEGVDHGTVVVAKGTIDGRMIEVGRRMIGVDSWHIASMIGPA